MDDNFLFKNFDSIEEYNDYFMNVYQKNIPDFTFEEASANDFVEEESVQFTGMFDGQIDLDDLRYNSEVVN